MKKLFFIIALATMTACMSNTEKELREEMNKVVEEFEVEVELNRAGKTSEDDMTKALIKARDRTDSAMARARANGMDSVEVFKIVKGIVQKQQANKPPKPPKTTP